MLLVFTTLLCVFNGCYAVILTAWISKDILIQLKKEKNILQPTVFFSLIKYMCKFNLCWATEKWVLNITFILLYLQAALQLNDTKQEGNFVHFIYQLWKLQQANVRVLNKWIQSVYRKWHCLQAKHMATKCQPCLLRNAAGSLVQPVLTAQTMAQEQQETPNVSVMWQHQDIL